MKDYPFISCLKPERIYNKYSGQYLTVRCGHCDACNQAKSSLATLKCQLESLSHKYCYFVTLTYSNAYIPLAAALRAGDHHYLVNVTERCGSVGDEILGYIESDPAFMSDLAKKVNLDNLFPYLCKRDLQLFMKRLRKRISNNYQYVIKDKRGSTIRRKYFPWQILQPLTAAKDEEVQKHKCGESIRYYACGEYGPKHFRPHFHLLLFFDNLETAQSLQHFVHESWPYGRVDVQRSLGDAAQYTASYVNSSCALPQVFKLAKTRPFATHSYFLGEAFLKSQLPNPTECRYDDFNRVSCPINGAYTEFSLWRSLKAYYYPRCKAYSSLDTQQRLTAYRTYAYLSDWSGETRPSVLADIVCRYLVEPNCYSDDYRLKTALNYFMESCQDLVVHGSFSNITEDEYIRVKRSIYTELRVSKQFCDYVCSGILDCNNMIKKIHEIEKYYDHCSMEILNGFYDHQEEYYDDDPEIDDLVMWYDNVPIKDDLIKSFERSPIYQQFRSDTAERSERSIKHKKLNDLNGYFNNK